MKKNAKMLSAVLLSIGLMAFSYGFMYEELQCNTVASDEKEVVEVDFFYDLGPRYDPITKQFLNEVVRVTEFNTPEENQRIVTLKSTELIFIENDKQTNIRFKGESEMLTEAQLAFLHSAQYSSCFLVRTEFYSQNPVTGEAEFNYYSPHLTVVPEKQAVYKAGKEKLLAYFAKNNKENTLNLDEKKLRPAKLYFTVDKTGQITNVKLDRTSGYADIDDTMIDLLTHLEGDWEAAENEKGEKVDQELAISFGMLGC